MTLPSLKISALSIKLWLIKFGSFLVAICWIILGRIDLGSLTSSCVFYLLVPEILTVECAFLRRFFTIRYCGGECSSILPSFWWTYLNSNLAQTLFPLITFISFLPKVPGKLIRDLFFFHDWSIIIIYELLGSKVPWERVLPPSILSSMIKWLLSTESTDRIFLRWRCSGYHFFGANFCEIATLPMLPRFTTWLLI